MPVISRLRHRLGIILPSRDRRGGRLTAKTRRVIREVVADWFGHAFPGSTEDRMQIRTRLRGRWGTGVGVTVEEIEGDVAHISAGPPTGTLVVTTGAAELYGAEIGVGGGH